MRVCYTKNFTDGPLKNLKAEGQEVGFPNRTSAMRFVKFLLSTEEGKDFTRDLTGNSFFASHVEIME